MQRFCIIFKFSIMPRKPRESSGTGIYHVMLRGINRQDIFDDTEDYWTFIRMMSAVPCYIYAYCLMPNHVHLLIAEKSLKVGEVVKSIASCYVPYYNKKYGRIGHLLQDRFKSEPCNDSGYFLTLFSLYPSESRKDRIGKDSKRLFQNSNSTLRIDRKI